MTAAADLAASDASARLVDHALGLRWADVSPAAQDAARAFLRDTLCVGAAGAHAPRADAVLSLVAGWGEGGGCTVLGRPQVRLPPASAAFVNAWQIHCQEFDCVHEAAVLHPLATIVAGLKAQIDQRPCAGRDVLVALVVGVDVSVTLGLAATTPLRFFRPSTACIFGAVAALARLRGLTRAKALDAFGYALAFASGTMQAHVEGKPALALQVAAAARSAVVAVDLAEAGFEGAQASLEGPFGYFNLFETEVAVAPSLAELAARRRIAELSFKPFPTGRGAHGGLVAVAELMAEHGVTASGVETLGFRAPPLIRRLVGRPAVAAMDVGYARLCLPWLAAVALRRGSVGLGDFGPELRNDPELLDLAARIVVEEDGSTDPATFTPLVATARLRDGTEARVRVDAMLGGPGRPLTPEQQSDKARRCLAFAGREESALAGLTQAILDLDRSSDAATAFAI